ncbi:MAG: hypothetical protein V1765_03245 [bacterium]
MQKVGYQLITCFVIGLISSLFFLPAMVWAESANSSVTVSVYYCGDNNTDAGESCDGTDLNGSSCTSLGYASGTLTCKVDCTFNTSQCNSGGGGGGGGGGGSTAPSKNVVYVPDTFATFVGKAYPGSEVVLLQDAKVTASVVVGADANFTITLNKLTAGNFIFSLYTEDKYGQRSSLLTFPVSVTEGATTTISGIFIAPTIAVDKSQVKLGDNLAIMGQSFPSSKITITVNSDTPQFFSATADTQGVYLYNLDTAVLEVGQHLAKSKATVANEISGYSSIVSFTVGDKNVLADEQKKKSDVNKDNRVNLVDFSIMAYWHGKSDPPVHVDLNNDKKVTLVDFSIMAYYWEG